MELVTRVIHLIGPQIHGTRAGEAPRLGTVDARSRLVPMDQGDTSQRAAAADRVLFQPGGALWLQLCHGSKGMEATVAEIPPGSAFKGFRETNDRR